MNELQGKPAVREPAPCGQPHSVAAGREPSQLGWFQFVAERSNLHTKGHRSVIDVGAGVGAGIAYLRYLSNGSAYVHGCDIDPRITTTFPNICYSVRPLMTFGKKCCDIVTCMDVIEHVVNDAELLREMLEMAKETVYVSTPNLSRSGAKNLCHAREYTIGEFMNVFRPQELWVGSPDGWSNRMLLLKQHGETVFCWHGNESWPVGEIPETVKFDQGSVDGLEWAHFRSL